MWWTAIFALFVAILSGLGVGSAGLLVVFLTAVEHLPQLTAQGLNLLFFVFSSGASLIVHMLRIPILLGCILLLLPSGAIGTFLGTVAAHALPQALLRRLFGLSLIASGAMGLFKSKRL